jgi:cystathionine beta-synthase
MAQFLGQTATESPPPMQVFGNVLDSIGNTPLLRIGRIDTGPCALFLKLENQNPGGSIKDRIALSMIEAAESDGRLRPGGTVIEATAGNTGLGLALVTGQKGYRLILVIPDKMALEKVNHLRALGAEVHWTRSDVGKGHPEYYQDVAERLAGAIDGALYINQFANPANPLAQETGTGPEIWRQMEQQVDAVVCGVGSGGTLTGLGRFFRQAAPEVKMVLADTDGSVLAGLVQTGRMGEAGSWLVEGIGEDFVPPDCDLSLVSEAISISDKESFLTGRELLRREGILAGSSTGTLLAAALRWCRAQSAPKRVVTLACDTGNKYLSKMFNDFWMLDQGFIERERSGDLRDLIARRHAEQGTVTVSPDDTLMTAYKRMRVFDVSQLPVMAEGEVVGLVDETDLLWAIYGHQERFKEPVSQAMSKRLDTLPATRALSDLLPIFARGHTAIVMEGDEFLGLITPVDLLNHLRRSLP